MFFCNVRRLSAACLLVVPTLASAAGFSFGENGAAALAQGGAFVGQADDLTAIQLNPAGLTQLSGFSFMLEGSIRNHDVTFQRKDASVPCTSDGNPPPKCLANPVSNSGGLFLSPNVGLGYGMSVAGRAFTVALGMGRYAYPAPNYKKDLATGRFVETPIKFAPERYGLLNSDTIILYPSLAAAYQLTPHFSAGVSIQYVYSHLTFRQAVYSNPFDSAPATQKDESPDLDSLVTVNMFGKPAFTAILGVMVRPTQSLSIGASFRPPVPVATSGALTVEPGKSAMDLGAQVSPDPQADMSLTLPMELKLGAYFRPTPALGFNADLVYEGWQSLQEIVLVPRDVTLTLAGGPPMPLPPVRIPKHYHHTFSGRVGGSYRLPFGLTVRGGALFEEAAAPDENTNIDFLHFTRVFLTGGLGYSFGPVEVLAGGAFLPTQSKDVTNSQVAQANTYPTPSAIVGNGTYISGGWMVTAGIRGRFGVSADNDRPGEGPRPPGPQSARPSP